MRHIITAICILAFMIVLSSCEDSLGINGADYLKSKHSDDTLYIDTMINYKKVTIIKVITKTDTIIEYVNRNIIYDKVYSISERLAITEKFDDFSGNKASELMDAPYTFSSFLDYNPLTPELSLSMELDNSKNTDSVYYFKKRNEIIKKFSFKFDNVNVINDAKIQFADFMSNTGDNIFLETTTLSGDTKVIDPKNISGYIQFGSREINKGQISSIIINGHLEILSNQKTELKNYSLEFQILLNFPEF